ncbi:MAG: penicillin-binding protein [Bacteroidetes bacterium]|nr:penicillin-binding protein [Bacteroidota bacterium]MDA1119653.1 penicillin-binding protein [Bacteroidota bacterium]
MLDFIPERVKRLTINLVIMVAISIFLVIFFFYVYLPISTNHGESITVPNLEGIGYDELDEFLMERDLRYEILPDSGFASDYPALSVLNQFPLPNSKVKQNRKIYITLNGLRPPMVRMPNLIDGSVKNAQLVLQSKDLKRGKITYKPDLAANAVLDQLLNGKTVEIDELIPKGSVIDLVVGDGLGRQDFEAPDLVGLHYEDAEFAVVASGLKMGYVRFEKEAFGTEIMISEDGDSTYQQFQYPAGVIFKQRPRSEDKIRIGESVDLWVVELDSTNLEIQVPIDTN